MLIAFLVIAFSILQLEALLNRKNPIILTHSTPLIEESAYSMANSDFMIAFAIEHWHSGGKSDPKYIQWVVHREIFTDSFQTSAEWYQTHRCTDEEFERFYPTMPDA